MADGGRTDDGEQLAVAVDGWQWTVVSCQLPVDGGRGRLQVAWQRCARRAHARRYVPISHASASAFISVYQQFHFRSVRRAAAPLREKFRRFVSSCRLRNLVPATVHRPPTTVHWRPRPLPRKGRHPRGRPLTAPRSPRFDPGSQRISVNQWFLSPPARPRRAHARRYRPPVPLPFRPSRRCAVARDSPPV